MRCRSLSAEVAVADNQKNMLCCCMLCRNFKRHCMSWCPERAQVGEGSQTARAFCDSHRSDSPTCPQKKARAGDANHPRGLKSYKPLSAAASLPMRSSTRTAGAATTAWLTWATLSTSESNMARTSSPMARATSTASRASGAMPSVGFRSSTACPWRPSIST